ncbi:MAG TPA: DUF3105 domain-containing protein [Thermoleophilaceae bacterium]|nr:DUF3105 domain-containing protein [Thermoleophilaceae bacterium]
MASRKEEKERLKAERLERERQAQAGERRKRMVGYGVGGVLAVAAVVALLAVALSGGDGDAEGGDAAGGGGGDGASAYPEGSVPEQRITDLDQAVEAAGCELEESRSEGNTHVEPGTDVSYKGNPPTSGDHYPVPAEDGVYDEQPQIGNLVHAHEHGRVVIQFDPEVPEGVKGDLLALYEEDPYHMILSPNATDMPYEVAATAWTRTLGCEEVSPEAFDAIRAFRDEFRDEGPEFVP